MRGTIKKQRGIPKELQAKAVFNLGVAYMAKNNVLAVKFSDRKIVYLITTAEDSGFVPKIKYVRGEEEPLSHSKPEAIEAYNLKMGGVDFTDQYLSQYTIARKSRVWFKKLGLHYLQRLVLNSFLRYKYERDSKASFLNFTKKAIIYFIGQSSDPVRHRGSDLVPTLAGEMHFPELIPGGQTEKQRRLKCRHCAAQNQRRDTQYRCSGCHGSQPLCISCFRP